MPWSHNLLLLGKRLNDETTQYYAQETVTKGWNRDLLLNAIKLNMYETQALARVDNNFGRTLLPNKRSMPTRCLAAAMPLVSWELPVLSGAHRTILTA